MKFFNEVTGEIYNFAYVVKHSQFRNYLNGQQQFCWNVIKQIYKLAATWQCYVDGIIPKDNISLRRYTDMPVDPNVKDVSHVSRALRNVTTTMSLLSEQEKFLGDRLSSITDMAQLWVRNEPDFTDFIQDYIATTKELYGEVLLLENNLSFILKTLEKRFNKAEVEVFDASPKRRWKKSKSARTKRSKESVHPDQSAHYLKFWIF